MSGSALLPYLPLVGAVLGGVIGGFVGAYTNGRVRAKEEQEALDRERRGLLLLIDAEVYSHVISLENLQEKLGSGQQTKVAKLNLLATPRSEDWDRSKERLAQLLPTGHMKDLIIYYKALKDIVAITSRAETEQYRGRLLAELGTPLIAQAKAIREHGKNYLEELPNYSEPGFDALPSPSNPNASGGVGSGGPARRPQNGPEQQPKG